MKKIDKTLLKMERTINYYTNGLKKKFKTGTNKLVNDFKKTLIELNKDLDDLLDKIINQKQYQYLIPNFFTLARCILTIAIPVTAITGNVPLTLLLSVIGAVSDKLDGLAASLFNAKSDFGAKADAGSDKFYILANFISLGIINPITLIPSTIMAAAEILISKTNIEAVGENKKARTNQIGRVKMVAICAYFLLAYINSIDPTLITGNIGFLSQIDPNALATIIKSSTIVSMVATMTTQGMAYREYVKSNTNTENIEKPKVISNEPQEEPQQTIEPTNTYKFNGYHTIKESSDLKKQPRTKKRN